MTAPVGCLDGEQAIRDALAAGPTPGPWVWAENYQGLFGAGPDNEVISYYGYEGMHLISHRSPANAGLIAACNPETMRALLAELDRLRSASRQEGWQPIETAPKDRDVLLCCKARGVVRGRWDDCRFANKPKPYWTNDREHLWGVLATRNDQPTHWQPLPAAPHQSQEAQGDRHGE